MSQKMSISVNGQSQVPPGFRFHPTEEELLHYYLRKKVSNEKIDLDVIRDVDLNKLEPWEIQESCKIGTTPQNDWYFFSHKDKKYPTGTRTNRATAVGFWKATGRDKAIYSTGKRVGMRKTLVFYKGRAPHGQKSDWITHEYRLEDNNITNDANISNVMGDSTQEEGWVVCRIFKKKNHLKTLDCPSSSSSITADTRGQMLNSCNEGALDQLLHYMGRSCKEENEANSTGARYLGPIDITAVNNIGYNDRMFMRLPSLESPNSSSSSQNCYQPLMADNECSINNQQVSCENQKSLCLRDYSGLTNWAALDRLVAFQLNGHSETSRQLPSFNIYPNPNMAFRTHHDLQLPDPPPSFELPSNRTYHGTQDYNSDEIGLWN